jgi:steroid 5-alpha reductase family enzyme
LLISDVAATVFTFIFSLIFRNASVYDPYWSVQPMVIVLCFVYATHHITVINLIMLIAVHFWGIRLTANWAYTFHGLSYEDWRYRMLREKTGPFYPVINFLGIHMVPTLIVYLCTLPAVFVVRSGEAGNALSYVFIAVSFFAAILQGAADVQMHRFRKRAEGGFIREGLWKYSRHPNYLGEILMWWGIGLSSVATLGGEWYLLAGALANTLLFLFVSIPMADKRQARKVGFAEYKRATRMLLPIPKNVKGSK